MTRDQITANAERASILETCRKKVIVKHRGGVPIAISKGAWATRLGLALPTYKAYLDGTFTLDQEVIDWAMRIAKIAEGSVKEEAK